MEKDKLTSIQYRVLGTKIGHSDAVYFCDGWEQSCGCSIEHDVVMRYIAHNRKNFVLMYEN